jgi:hypothetical protein
VFDITVNSTDPIYVHCGVSTTLLPYSTYFTEYVLCLQPHCRVGMVMIINPASESDLETYRAAAEDKNFVSSTIISTTASATSSSSYTSHTTTASQGTPTAFNSAAGVDTILGGSASWVGVTMAFLLLLAA